ncbi:signal peptidase II [Candidatus Woesearchaeota archaeon]|nr:signal peptidase II [Candidatus Woesearchaeota archaeon]
MSDCTALKGLLLVRSVAQDSTDFFIIALFVVAIDQVSKYFVRNLRYDFVKNTGAIFGVLKGATGFLIVVSLVVIFLLFWYRKDILKQKKIHQVCYALVLGGVIGNLIDRVVYGYVIDFIDFKVWPVFNLADVALSVGVLLLVYLIIREK